MESPCKMDNMEKTTEIINVLDPTKIRCWDCKDWIDIDASHKLIINTTSQILYSCHFCWLERIRESNEFHKHRPNMK